MARTDSKETEKMLGSLISVFRDHGFEGASLSRFTEASGLIKASLYHRFPRGKEAMGLAALAEVDRIFSSYVLAPIDADGDRAKRLRLVATRLDKFYEGGTRGCLLESMATAGTPPSVKTHLKRTLDFWIGKFAQLAEEAGIPKKEARVRAEGAIAAIEGALVVSRAQGNNKEFKRSLDSLHTRLLTL